MKQLFIEADPVGFRLSRADYDRSRRAYHLATGLATPDPRLPKLLPPGAVAIHREDQNPAWDIAADPALFEPAIARRGRGVWVSVPQPSQNGKSPPHPGGLEYGGAGDTRLLDRAWVESAGVRMVRFTGDILNWTEWTADHPYDPVGVPMYLLARAEWREDGEVIADFRGWELTVRTPGFASATMVGAGSSFKVWFGDGSELVGNTDAYHWTGLRPVSAPAAPTVSDDWWYDTPWGRELVEWPGASIVMAQYGSWETAIEWAAPGARLLVRVPHMWLRGLPEPKVEGATAPNGAGHFAEVPVRAGMVPVGRSGNRYDLVDAGGGAVVGRWYKSESTSFWSDPLKSIAEGASSAFTHVVDEAARAPGNVEQAATHPGEYFGNAVDRLGNEIAREASDVNQALVEPVVDASVSAYEKTVAELNRVDDNLKHYIVHPRDAAIALGRDMAKGAVVVIVGAATGGLASTILGADLFALPAILLDSAGPAVGLISPGAGAAIAAIVGSVGSTALVEVAAAAGVAVVRPEDVEGVAKASVYLEGFIPLAPQLLEELTIQAQTSREERDGLRVDLAKLRADVASRGGAWLVAAKRAFTIVGGAAASLALLGAGAALLGGVGQAAQMFMSVAQAALGMANAAGLAQAARHEASLRNQALVAAAADRAAKAKESLADVNSEIAELERQLAALGQHPAASAATPHPAAKPAVAAKSPSRMPLAVALLAFGGVLAWGATATGGRRSADT